MLHRRRGSIPLGLALCAGLFLGSTAAGQTIWYVDAANCPGPGDGSADNPFCEIQTAINAAAANATPPDEIEVADGVYTGAGNKNLDFGGKIIKLRSASGDPAQCIIDCEGDGRGFYFHSGETAEAEVRGLTIRNGLVTSSSPGGAKGGGVYCFISSPTLTNCTISGNTTTGTSYGGGMCCSSSSPALANCTINGNTATAGGGVYCSSSASTLTNCTISGNSATSDGGGVCCTSSSSPVLTNCTIGRNTSTSSGGGVLCYSSSPTLTNCTICENTSTSKGGGVYCTSSSSPVLTNCTISRNTSTSSGGGVYCSSSTPSLANCILWGDAPQEIYVYSGTPVVTYCDIQGGYTGEGNIAADPGFAFADDFHLLVGSPCIDSGTNSPTGGLPAQDADGNARLLDGDEDGTATTDMGVYEFNPATASIAISPRRIVFFVNEGEVGLEPMGLSIRNAGGGTLHWAVDWEGTWLQSDQREGESTGEVDNVVLTADATNLSHGAYSTTIVVSDPLAVNDPQTVEVILYVTWTLNVPGAYATIQSAIDAAGVAGDQVIIADGIYTGTGNKNLDFGGKPITVRSAGGDPATCIIDCEGDGRGFYFHSGETAETEVRGITIRNGYVTSSSPGGASGGGVFCSSSNPALTDCTISDNAASDPSASLAYGGGVYCSSSGPTLTNCLITGNTVTGPSPRGGGMHCVSSSNPTLTNCAITGNSAMGPSSMGGGVYCYSSSNPTLTNCTIAGNSAMGSSSQGGGVYCTSSSPMLTNCILWGDAPSEVYVTSGAPVVTYCNVQGGYTGAGNIDLDPGFAFSDDFHLMPGSPCIDAGTDTPLGGLPPGDAEGNPRTLDGNGDGQANADIGMYEFNPSAPAIASSPIRITFSIYEGEVGQTSEDLSIRNSGGGTLHWGLNWEASWLQVDVPQGESTGEVDTVQLTADGTALTHGTYFMLVSLADPQASNTPRLVEVVLHITRTLYVPGEYSTIQAAIDAAVVPGDQVVVADGIYLGIGNKNLDFAGKAIKVRSASGNALDCVIDCQGDGRGFYFHRGETAAAIVQGFTICNGNVTSSSPGGGYGGGVSCSGASPTLTNCTIKGCTSSSYGGGVYCTSSDPTLTNCTIDGNYGASAGGGMYCTSSNVTLVSCMIIGNTTFSSTAMASGGGLLCASSNINMVGCKVCENTAASSSFTVKGGGIYSVASHATLTNCTISNNTAFTVGTSSNQARGGGVCCVASSPIFANCRITGNKASVLLAASSAYGGGIYGENAGSTGPSPNLTNCIIMGNEASGSVGSSGGGLYCTGSASSPQLTNCILWGDSPQEITVASGALTVTYCDVQGGYPGDGNINLDPGFFAGDFHLHPDSPCIDAGTNSPDGGLPAQDADGNPRALDGNGDGQAIADMGTCEFNSDAPAIAVSPSLFTLFIRYGSSGQEPQHLSIRNVGTGTLSWSLNGGCSWLQLGPTEGETTSETDAVTVTVDISSLLPGVYATTLEVVDPQASNNPQIVEVVLNVTRTLYVPTEYGTIQSAINGTMVPGDQVVLADGTYTGAGNKNLDFHGKAITVRSASGDPTACIIDCEGNGRGFYFHSGETAAAVVEGLTIQNGFVNTSSTGAARGGGAYCYRSNPTFRDCIITGCEAVCTSTSTSSLGGGVYCSAANLTLEGCSINGNTVFSSCSSSSYSAYSYGGGVCCEYGMVALSNCTISENVASAEGYAGALAGGLRCYQAGAVLADCTICGNQVTCEDADAAEDGFGGGVCLSVSTATMVRCLLSENTAPGRGGGIYCTMAEAKFVGCVICSNAARYGGGVYLNSSDPMLTSCILIENIASTSTYSKGGGICCSASDPRVTNCLFSQNHAVSGGGGISCTSSSPICSPVVANCIMWGDTPQEISGGAPVVTYCDIQGGYAGTANINLNPLFVDPDGPDNDPATWQDNDYRLAAGSPCIDAGLNSAVPADTLDLDGDGDTNEPIPFDLDGLPRFVDDPAAADCPYVPDTCGDAPIVDMGVYEYQPPVLPGDLNCDGVVDVDDVSPFALALVDPVAYQAAYPGCDSLRADLDASGAADGSDVQLFVALLVGP